MLPSSGCRSELGFQSYSQPVLLHFAVLHTADDRQRWDKLAVHPLWCIDCLLLPFYYRYFNVARQGNSR